MEKLSFTNQNIPFQRNARKPSKNKTTQKNQEFPNTLDPSPPLAISLDILFVLFLCLKVFLRFSKKVCYLFPFKSNVLHVKTNVFHSKVMFCLVELCFSIQACVCFA